MPGGHEVLLSPSGLPHIASTREMDAVPLRHTDVVVDVGAYVGTYAIRCARFPVRRVVAYEPTPSTFAVLSQTSLPNLEVVQAAVVPDDRSDVRLYVSRGIGVSNSVVRSRGRTPVVVPAVRYETAVAAATVVKVDVEGLEYSLPLVQPGVRALLVDFHPVGRGRDWVARALELIAVMEDAGFRAVAAPEFDAGGRWTTRAAGAWVRDVEEPHEVHGPLVSGRLCCGCGAPTIGDGARAVCRECAEQWLPRHLVGYDVVERDDDPER